MKKLSFRERSRGALVAACCLAALLAGCQTAPPAPAPRPAQAEVLRSLGFAPADDGWTLSLATPILFDPASDVLKPAQQRSVVEMAVELRRAGISRIRIEGHTDSTGQAGYNVELARRRAEAVAREFVAQGFPDAAIDRKAWGYAHPAAPNETAEGRALNRRVTIVVLAAGPDAD